MKSIFCIAAIVASFSLAVAAFAQSTPAPASDTPAPAATPASSNTPSSNTAAAVPVPSSKRFACQAASQGMKGQERRDQTQLCIAQARVDCLKQAIDQKIVGPQRIEFVKNCLQ